MSRPEFLKGRVYWETSLGASLTTAHDPWKWPDYSQLPHPRLDCPSACGGTPLVQTPWWGQPGDHIYVQAFSTHLAFYKAQDAIMAWRTSSPNHGLGIFIASEHIVCPYLRSFLNEWHKTVIFWHLLTYCISKYTLHCTNITSKVSGLLRVHICTLAKHLHEGTCIAAH